MARDSQPPPPQLIADLQDRLDALQSEFDECRTSSGALKEANLRLTGECSELEKIVKERDEEIVYLQEQLEAAVAELAEAKFGDKRGAKDVSNCPSASAGAESSTTTPLRIMADMKQRLHTLEDRLSHCNLQRAS